MKLRRRNTRWPRPRATFVLLLAALLALVALPGAAQAKEKRFTVMTWNLYLGTTLDNLAGQTGLAFVAAVTQDWNNIVATNFPARAEALADEVELAQPDLIGLQEVELIREQKPADSFVNPNPNAVSTVYDYLSLVLSSLQARGLNYQAVATSTNADAEAPRFDATSPNGFTDVRITDRDVILARADVASSMSNPQDGRYGAQLSVPAGGRAIQFTRGWASVDVTVEGGTFRFFNSHLETAGAPAIQVSQGNEALGLIGASPVPVIAVGDFNSAADGSTTATYANLTAQLSDAWSTANPGEAGFTCCQNELLTNTSSLADERIDLIFTSSLFDVTLARLVGATQFAMSPPLWAADHLGVVAELKLKTK
jgi:endonuclease/exonuclease/phosphatase family metal-dependent hydrolase